MKRLLPARFPHAACTATFLFLLSLMLSPGIASAATKTWTGLGTDGKWQTGANWSPSGAASGDALVFTGTTRITSTNNFTAGTPFSGISFATPAGPFTLNGNSLSLTGDISDSQVISLETIALNFSLSATHNVDVTPGGLLTLGGVVSGAAGAGLTKVDGGQLTLGGANTFSGPVTINGGNVFITSDSNLGAVPVSPTPGSIVLNGGTLTSTNTFTLNTNRGIALGPVSGVGSGTFDVKTLSTLTYRGIIANAGTNGGLNKLSFGTLVLAGSNTYTGPTLVSNGTLSVDFTQATSPTNNLINTNSSLALGGATAGIGVTNYAELIVTPKAGTTNSQAFKSTSISTGPTVILVNTNTTGGTANLALGSLTHTLGGLVTIVPPSQFGGTGKITTTALNTNGILGGWAFIGGSTLGVQGVPYATNFAMVDGTGSVTNTTNLVNWVNTTSGNLKTVMSATTNVEISGTGAGDVTVDVDNAPGSGSTNDVNAMLISMPIVNWSLKIGSNNVMRLGKYGAILSAQSGSAITWEIGSSAGGNNTTADQNTGTLTAGGPTYNTPGELVLMENQTATGSANNLDIDVKIDDNGPSGPVTLIKAGTGYVKLRGHNTYSGGTYYLGGRIQFAGTDVGTANPDAVGTGPCFVFPGAYLYNPPVGFSNAVFLAGNGSVGEPIGAFRAQSTAAWSNSITLIGDATIGGANGTFAGKISGPFNLTFGSGATGTSVAGNNIFSNPGNNWTGNTIMQSVANRNNGFINGASEVIPDGFGFGNVTLQAGTPNTIFWNLSGWNETINGLSTAGVAADCIVTNSTTTNSILALGNNDQSGSFAGAIAGNISLVKIGAGTETLSAVDNYTGSTTVSNGTLVLTGSGAIPNSSVLVTGTNSLATLDVSGVAAGFTTANSVGLTNGTFIGNTAAGGIANFSVTNSALTVIVNPAVTNIFAGTLTTGGTTNLINIGAVQGITAYPSTFNIIKYTTGINGAGFNFGIGSVPSAATAGYVSNYVAGGFVQLVLTNGPKPLVWTGLTDGTTWDINNTINWLAFKGTAGAANAPFNNQDSVQFDDSAPAADTNINVTSLSTTPGGIVVSNNVLNYNFNGTGALIGAATLVKQGTANLVVANTGGNSLTGGINVSGGGTLFVVSDNAVGMTGGTTIASGSTVQVGTNNGAGMLPAGNIQDDGSLVFDRGADLQVGNVIAGSSGLTKIDASTLTLSGGNTFTGNVSVVSGTLKTGNGTALGVTNGTTTISSGATLDVNGQSLGGEPILVSGTGIGGNGAIVNSGSDQINALQNVTVNGGSVTFGGSGRWDIRGATATAGLFGSAGTYTLTKTGINQVAFVSITVDNNLGDININQGILGFQVLTTSLGNPANTITVNPTATLDLYNLTAGTMAKNLVLNGDGVTNTVFAENGNTVMTGTVTLNNGCIFNISGTSLTFDNASTFGGTGSLTMSGGGTLALNGSIAVGGPINVNGGTLNLGNVNTGGGTLTNASGTTITSAGSSGNNGAVQIGGALLPGGTNAAGTFTVGTMSTAAPLTVTNSTLSFDFTLGGKDQIVVNGGLNLQGTNLIIVNPVDGSIHTGDQVNLITYTGSLTGGSNNFVLAPPPPGYSWTLLDPATTLGSPNTITLSIVHVPVNQTWIGGHPNNVWDTTNTANWQTNSVFDVFNSGDNAIFNDTAATKTVSVTGTNLPEDMNFQNATPYTLTGTGKITGPGTLEISGGGLVQFANTGTNDFSGAIGINNGILSIGNGGVGGDVGPGTNTLNGTLLFNRSDDFTYHNSISSGTGTMDKTNTDTVFLNGNSPLFTGTILVDQGTLKLGSSTALGTNNTAILVRSGATIDFTNNVNINVGGNGGGQVITIAGAGVTNGGAIVNSGNSGTASGANFANVTLTNDLTIGGNGRLDWYGVDLTSSSQGSLNTFNNPYNLIKVGSNQLQLQALNIDAGFANFIVQGGTLGFQGNLPSLGNVSSNLIIYSNATLNLYQVSNVMYKTMILSNGATVYSQSGSNLWGGQVVLNGSNSFNVTSWLGLSNTISGSGGPSLITGTSILYLPASNTYTGPTYINAGTLALVNDPFTTIDGSITHSSLIQANGTLDVSGRSDQTLTLASGQTVGGSGTINGTLIAPSGTTVSPGAASPGRLTVTTNATLNLGSTTLIRLSESPRTNDQLRVSRSGGTLTYGGTLTVTVSSGNMHGGEVFPLFSASNLAGSFSPINLPTLGPGLSWNTTALGTTGTISVTGTLTPPTISSINFLAPTLSLSGSGGTPNGPYVVISTTVITNALSTWTPVVTNHFDNTGHFSWSGSVGSTNAQQFFTIRE